MFKNCSSIANDLMNFLHDEIHPEKIDNGFRESWPFQEYLDLRRDQLGKKYDQVYQVGHYECLKLDTRSLKECMKLVQIRHGMTNTDINADRLQLT